MEKTKIIIDLPDNSSYDVRIGSNYLDSLGAYVRNSNPSEKALVLTDSRVGPLYATPVRESLKAAGYQVSEISIPEGETSKTLECVEEIGEAMAQKGFTRDSIVFGLGGGVVGDIAGFLASVYMRGIDLVQVPTSLLAMVDSSVGGKTGVNLKEGKNLIGSFKQPLYVCASLDVLETLSDNNWVCGCAEIAKSALIDSDDFFFWLDEHAPLLAQRDVGVTGEAIARSVVFKAQVVADDTYESKGIRECLNYGHTLGHAIETLAGYGTFSHGQAVAEGMRFASRLGAELAGTPLELVEAQERLLDKLGLYELDWADEPGAIIDAMHKDKKSRKGALRFVVPEDIGSWKLVEVEDAKVQEHLEAWAASKGLEI